MLPQSSCLADGGRERFVGSPLQSAGRDPAALTVVPFGSIADEGKLEHYARLGITEVVLRVRAGDEPSIRAELESLAPLLPFAATLEQP